MIQLGHGLHLPAYECARTITNQSLARTTKKSLRLGGLAWETGEHFSIDRGHCVIPILPTSEADADAGCPGARD